MVIKLENKVTINKIDHFGRGISTLYNKTVFVENALPTEEVKINITNNKKNYFEANVCEYLKKSNDRVEPLCPYFELCGGCNIMHMNYDKQLSFKRNKVIEIMDKFAKINSEKIKEIVKTDEFYYRNKITLQVSKKIGLYKKSSYEIVNIDKCYICNESINKIIKKLNDLKLENINQIIIRSSLKTNEVMIVFCIYNKIDEKYLVDNLKSLATSIVKRYKNDEKVLYGKSYITEKIGDYSFIISADSFFQVNTLGMEKLYGVVKKYLEPNKNMNVLDLYCGTGTIGIYISDSVKEVSGVEINKSAVKDAIKNAALNDINNIKFVCSDVKDVIKKYKNIDAVIVDPPRAGLSKEAIENLINLNASKIVYVSCDAVTLARDINILKDFYDLIEITPVDMFPDTYHIECVSILKLKVLK